MGLTVDDLLAKEEIREVAQAETFAVNWILTTTAPAGSAEQR